MNTTPMKSALVVLGAAALLVACGSNDNDAPPPAPVVTTDVPASAQQTSAGLVTYVQQLVGMTSETSEPILVGDATIPADDTSEPANIN